MSTQQIDISTMSVDERLSLLDQLWDSLHDSTFNVRLSAAQEAELDRRLDEVDAGNTGGRDWEEIQGGFQREKVSSQV